MNLKEFIETLKNNDIIWEELADNIVNLSCKQEYSFSNEGVYANGYFVEVKIENMPISGLRSFMFHRHKNAIINHKTNEDYNKQIIVPEDIVILADIEIYQVKNIRIYRKFGYAKI